MNLGIMRQVATIQCYIHHVKGIEVQINIPQKKHDITLLKRALQVANRYLN